MQYTDSSVGIVAYNFFAESKTGTIYFIGYDGKTMLRSSDDGKTWEKSPYSYNQIRMLTKFIDKNGILHVITHSMFQTTTLTGYWKSENPL